MSTGKNIRLSRITDRATGRMVIVPMDHGVTMGPLNGLKDAASVVNDVTEGGATAVLMHKGLIPHADIPKNDIGIIMHLSASTSRGNRKVLVSAVEEAVRSGADAVSMHVDLGGRDDDALIELGNVSKECRGWGMPLLVMAYPQNENDLYDPDTIAHCARAVSELGADIVKVSYTGSVTSFRKVVEGSLAPVVIAGGPKISSDIDILRMVRDSVEAGGKGVSIGRNIFQHANSKGMTRAISDIVLNDSSIEDACAYLR